MWAEMLSHCDSVTACHTDSYMLSLSTLIGLNFEISKAWVAWIDALSIPSNGNAFSCVFFLSGGHSTETLPAEVQSG